MSIDLETTAQSLAEIFERSGLEGVIEIINDDLIPLAKKENISIDQAIKLFADANEEQDTTYYQLHMVMCCDMSLQDVALYEKLDIFTPL